MLKNEPSIDDLKADKRRYIQALFNIVDGDSQKAVPFIFRSEQNKYWDNRSVCDIILKPRKRGFSSLIDAEFLAACLLEHHTHALVVAHRDDDTKLLFDRVRWMKDNLPFPVNIKAEGAGHLIFPDTESDFRVITAGASDPGRGRDITQLHLSERAFYPHEEFLAAVEGACTRNARRVIETTANGSGTAFHKFWLRTKQGLTAYKWHFFPWWASSDYEMDIPGPLIHDHDEKKLIEAYGLTDRKLAWRRQKLREMSNPDLFDQEFPHSDESAFLTSGRMVFDWVSIQRHSLAMEKVKWQGQLHNIGQKIELMPSPSGPLRIWSTPKEDRRYVISADVAEGLPDGAWSVCDVLDTSSWEQVAQWRGHCTPSELADVLGDLGAYYNWGTVVPEVNNHGLATCGRLADGGYPNLYVREEKKEGVSYGWLTTVKSKIMIINALSHALKSNDIRINSDATLEELKSFVYAETRDKMEAQAGAFSDCVMSLAIGVAILNDLRETPQTARQRFKEAMGLRRSNIPNYSVMSGYGVRKC